MKKQQYSWHLVAEVKGEDMSLGTFWTDEEAAKHFKTGYEWQNDPSSRSGNVSIQSVWYNCRKYISDSAEEGRIYVRIVELEGGTQYKIEQGYPIDDGDDEDASRGQSRVASDADEPEPVEKKAKGRGKNVAAAPELRTIRESTMGSKPPPPHHTTNVLTTPGHTPDTHAGLFHETPPGRQTQTGHFQTGLHGLEPAQHLRLARPLLARRRVAGAQSAAQSASLAGRGSEGTHLQEDNPRLPRRNIQGQGGYAGQSQVPRAPYILYDKERSGTREGEGYTETMAQYRS